MKKISFIIISILLISSCQKKEVEKFESKFTQAGLSTVSPNIEAPDFILKTLEGKQVSLNSFEGKVVILNFWASWCGPCKAEMPSIESLYNKTKDLNIVILAVNLGESESTVKSYIDSNNFSFTVLLDTDKTVGTEYGVRSIPTTYILDKNGMAVAGKLGSYEWDNNKIISLLKDMAE